MSRFKFSHGCKRVALLGSLIGLSCFASGCSAVHRLSQIGEQPKLTSIDNPTTQPGYKPVSMPMPKPETVSYSPNSLWRNGSRSFFHDPSAPPLGDPLPVSAPLNRQGQFANETQRDRTTSEDSGITN